jgi:hypothetical protein
MRPKKSTAGGGMKKSFIVAALAATAVAMPATSSADSAQKSTAKGPPDLTINFDLIVQGNDPLRIENFKFQHFTAACAVNGPAEIKGSISQIGLNKKEKFHNVAKTKNGNGKVIVEGQVKQNGDKTLGTLKAKGDFKGGAKDCSAKIAWEAT